jgi:PLP dependent protein
VTDDDVAGFARAREDVLGHIAGACARSGRDPAGVTLVAISKTVSPERLQAADKVPLLSGVTWHLVGPLQSNKARRAVELFDVIESVDSLDLGLRLDRLAREIRPGNRRPVLIQVNVDDDPSKAGLAPPDLPATVDALAACEGLELRGLMTIGRLVADPEEARPTFRRLREASAALRAGGHLIGPELSMGMSDDYPIAVEEGATIVRVGRAVFGARQPTHPGG